MHCLQKHEQQKVWHLLALTRTRFSSAAWSQAAFQQQGEGCRMCRLVPGAHPPWALPAVPSTMSLCPRSASET